MRLPRELIPPLDQDLLHELDMLAEVADRFCGGEPIIALYRERPSMGVVMYKVSVLRHKPTPYKWESRNQDPSVAIRRLRDLLEIRDPL